MKIVKAKPLVGKQRMYLWQYRVYKQEIFDNKSFHDMLFIFHPEKNLKLFMEIFKIFRISNFIRYQFISCSILLNKTGNARGLVRNTEL